MHREIEATREAPSGGWSVINQPDAREGQAGPGGVRLQLVETPERGDHLLTHLVAVAAAQMPPIRPRHPAGSHPDQQTLFSSIT
jgi:hypothetical protein